MSPGCVRSPKNRPFPLAYDFPSFSHVLATFLVAVKKYLARGNLKEGKGCLVSQLEVTQTSMAGHIASTRRNLGINRK